jgi:hypothetical protein
MHHDLDPEGERLPIKIDSTSNGEHYPIPLTADQIRANELAHRRVSELSRRLGLSRRQFLKTSAGAAATLLAFNEAHAQRGHTGGFFDIPADAGLDIELAQAAVGGNEFIFDVQNHVVDPNAGWKNTLNGRRWQLVLENNFVQAQKCAPGSLECYASTQFIKDVFLDADTSASVVSALWGPPDGNPTPIDYAVEVRELVNALGNGRRGFVHGGVMPNLPGAFDYMESLLEYDIVAWKLYPQWGENGFGFYMDDEETGIPFIEKARELGVNIICAHRGLPLPFLAYEYSHPRDIASAASMFPDVTFICYHSGFEPGKTEGPYDPEQDEGVNRLIRAHQDHGFRPNEGNLYAELGGVWNAYKGIPDQAAHVMGKLLRYFGEDRICWGTDTVWHGSPQDQIQAMRTFQISEEFQQTYGYPAITPEIKAKILGLNAARVYGVDPDEIRQVARADSVASFKANYLNDPNPGFESYGPKTRREFLDLLTLNGGRPG